MALGETTLSRGTTFMDTKRWIAGVAALTLAGAGSLYLAGAAAGQDDEHSHEEGEEHDMGDMDHDMDDMDDGAAEEEEGDRAAEEEAAEEEGDDVAPPVAEDPGFTG